MPKIVTDQEVFEAVIRTLVELGYLGATTKHIAEQAGVNEATLYRKYGSKEQLVNQAIKYMIQTADIDSHVYYSGDVRADLLRIVTEFFRKEEREPLFLILISEIRRFPELQSTIDAPSEVVMKVGRLLARYQSEGVLKQEHPFHAVAALAGPLIMNRLLKSTNISLPIPDPDLAVHVEQYLNGRQIVA